MIQVLLVSCCASARCPMPAMVPMAPVPHPMGFAPSPMAHHLPKWPNSDSNTRIKNYK